METLIHEIDTGTYPTSLYAMSVSHPIALTPGTDYRLTYGAKPDIYTVLYNDDGTPLPYTRLKEKLDAGEYPDRTGAVTPDPLTITSPYIALTTPDGQTLRAFIATDPAPSADSPVDIYYSDLLRGIASGLYPPIPAYTPETLSIESGEAIELHNPDGTTDTFTYRGKSPITYTELRRLITEGRLDPLTLYTADTPVEIAPGENITLRISGITGLDGTYTFTYSGESPIALGTLVEGITGGQYPAPPQTDPSFRFRIATGTPLVFTGLDGTTHRLIYGGQEDVTLRQLLDYIASGQYTPMTSTPLPLAGLYLFGSYDCRRWALLGGREAPGTLRDTGCLAARADCRYFRVLFTSKLCGGSLIERVDISASSRLLARKMR